MLTRYFSPQRKTWLTSLSVGIIVALLAGSIQFMVIYHNRAERFDAIINNVNTYLKSYFHDLRQTIDGLQPLVDQPCENIDSGLTSHAAFSPNVRAFLLVKNGIAFCSSATGAMNTPLSQLIPAIDISKPVAMAILPGTPMMPKSAALALWVGKPGDQNSGIFVSINANLTPYILYSRGKTISAALRWPSITPLSPPSVIGWWIRKRCITRRSARHRSRAYR